MGAAFTASVFHRNRARVNNAAGLVEGLRRALEHDPEKWVPVFGKDHAPARS